MLLLLPVAQIGLDRKEQFQKQNQKATLLESVT